MAANIQQLSREPGVFLAAWQHFTCIPLPAALRQQAERSKATFQTSARYAPLVGIIVGCVASLVFAGTLAVVDSKSIAVTLSILTSVLLTGAVNEDGIARFFEAFCSTSRSKYDILAILHERALGAIGITTLVFSLLLKYVTLLHIDTTLVPVALIVGHAFSRFAALSFVFTNGQADSTEPQKAQPPTHPVTFLVMAAFGMLPLLLVGNLLFLLLVPLLWIIRALVGVWFTQKVGGWTQQGLSAVLVLTEVATYLILAIALQYAFTNF